jgi:hypothetical protein
MHSNTLGYLRMSVQQIRADVRGVAEELSQQTDAPERRYNNDIEEPHRVFTSDKEIFYD